MRKNNRKNILKRVNAHSEILGTFFVALMLIVVSFSAVLILAPEPVRGDYDSTPTHYTISTDNVSNVHFDYAIQSDNTTIGVTWQSNRVIYYSTSTNGTVWSTPEQVGDDDIYKWDGNSNGLNMDYNSTDIPFIAYQEDNGGVAGDIKYAYKDPTWTEVIVRDDPGNDMTYGVNILMASWDDNYPQISSSAGSNDGGIVNHYNYSGGSWNTNLVKNGGAYCGGGNALYEWDGNLYCSFLDCGGTNMIDFYNASNWDGSNWGSVEWYWAGASGGHASGITKVNSTGYFLGAIVDDDTGDEVGYLEKAPGGTGSHNGVDTGYHGHYSKCGEAEVTANSTGVLFMSWILGVTETSTQSVHLISSSDGGTTWGDDITVFTHDGTTGGIKIARSTIIDDCVLVFYIDPVGTGSDGDLKVAVFGSYEGEEEPSPSASTYTVTGDDSDEFTFSIVSGGTAWTNVTNPGGTIIITSNTNSTDNCTDIYFDATSNLTYSGSWINADTMTLYASTDNSSWDSSGLTISTDGQNVSLDTNWASLSDSANPFPINGSAGAWENVTIYIIVHMDIGSFGAGSYVSSVDWAVKWRVNDYS